MSRPFATNICLSFTILTISICASTIQNITFYDHVLSSSIRRMAYGTYDSNLYMIGGENGGGEWSLETTLSVYNITTSTTFINTEIPPSELFEFELRFVSERCQIDNAVYFLPTNCATTGGCYHCYNDDCSVWKVDLATLDFTKLTPPIPSTTNDIRNGRARGSLCGFIHSGNGQHYLFHVGGQINEWQGVGINTTFLYNGTTNSWIQMGDLVIAASEGTCVGYNDKLYLFSGRQTPQIQIYDSSTNQWNLSTQAMDRRIMDVMPVVIPPYILLFGGNVNLTDNANYHEESVDWIQIYDTETYSLTRLPETLAYNTSSAAVSYDNETGLIYLIGGQIWMHEILDAIQVGCINCNEQYIIDNIEIFEIPTGNVSIDEVEFTLQNSFMPQNLCSMVYGEYEGTFVMIGGVYTEEGANGNHPDGDYPDNSFLSDRIMTYNLQNGKFEIDPVITAPDAFEVKAQSFAQIDNYLYFSFETCAGLGCGSQDETRQFWRFDFDSFDFDLLPHVPSGAGFGTMCGITSSADGLPYIFSIGGIVKSAQFDYVSDNNLYNVSSNTWSTRTEVPRDMLQAVCVGIDDTLYMFGSASDNKILQYKFLTDTWKQSLQTIRNMAGDAFTLMQMHAVVMSQLSYILLLGGTDYHAQQVSDLIMVYDYANDIMVNLDSTMAYPKTLGAMTLDSSTNVIYSFGGLKTNLDHGGIPTNEWSKGCIYGDPNVFDTDPETCESVVVIATNDPTPVPTHYPTIPIVIEPVTAVIIISVADISELDTDEITRVVLLSIDDEDVCLVSATVEDNSIIIEICGDISSAESLEDDIETALEDEFDRDFDVSVDRKGENEGMGEAVLILIICIVLLVLGVSILIIFIVYRKRKQTRNATYGSEEIENVTTEQIGTPFGPGSSTEGYANEMVKVKSVSTGGDIVPDEGELELIDYENDDIYGTNAVPTVGGVVQTAGGDESADNKSGDESSNDELYNNDGMQEEVVTPRGDVNGMGMGDAFEEKEDELYNDGNTMRTPDEDDENILPSENDVLSDEEDVLDT